MIRMIITHFTERRFGFVGQPYTGSIAGCDDAKTIHRFAPALSPFKIYQRPEMCSIASESCDAEVEPVNDVHRDAKLVEAALIGDRVAKNTLVEKLSPVISNCIRRLNIRNTTHLYEAHDFVQEIWARLFVDNGRLLKQYDSSRGVSLKSYISMVIKREIRNQIQKERALKRGMDVTVNLEETLDPQRDEETPEKFLEARELAARLDQQLKGILSDRGMDVLHKSFLKGTEPSEIAKELNVSVQVVYNWMHRIRALCRDFLEMNEDLL